MDANVETAEKAREMMEQSVVHFGNSFSINVYGVFIILIFLIIAVAMWKAHKDDKEDFNWSDMIKSPDQVTGKMGVSGTKLLQLIGGITATFIVVKLTLQAALTFEIFCAYLTYVASVEGFSKFIIAKYGVQNQNGDPAPKTVTKPSGGAKAD
jgi:hypothetical protein